MSKTNDLFGWDLLYNSVESKLAKKDDVLMALMHWYLTKHGFRCIGIGSEKNFNSNDVGSETLPNEWNTSVDGNYSLRYINNNILYVLCGTRTGDVLVLNLLRCSDYTVSSVTFKVELAVQALKGTLEDLMPSYPNTLKTIKEQLIRPVFNGNSREVHTQTTTESNPTTQPPSNRHEIPEPDPLRISQPHRLLSTGFETNWDPLNVGRSDLDPIGQPGGGMLFNPFGPGRGELRPGAGNLPRGAVPPGARFDPFSPIAPGPGRPQRPGGFGPDPDHLPPPGYDDMFM